MAKNSSSNIIEMLDSVFSKAPALPKNAQEAIVKITPILALIFGILGILGSLGGLGLLTVFSPFALMGGVSRYGLGFVSALAALVSSILLIMAYSGTKARKLGGWNMLFWSEVVSLAGSILSLSIISGIIGAVIAFYLLFQIKPYYK